MKTVIDRGGWQQGSKAGTWFFAVALVPYMATLGLSVIRGWMMGGGSPIHHSNDFCKI